METKEHLDQTAGEDNNQSENSTSNENIENVLENSEITSEENKSESTETVEEVKETVEEATTESKEEVVTESNDDSELTEAAAVAIANVQDDQSELIEEEEEDSVEEIHVYTEQELEAMTREELVIAMEDSVRSDNVTTIKANVSIIKIGFNDKTNQVKEELKKDFIEKGGKEEEFNYVDDSLDARFKGAFGIYREKRTKFQEEQEIVKVENLKKKTEILDELKVLINSDEPLKKTYDVFNDLQNKWKSIGMIPRTEINNLWHNYHFLVEKFFDKVKISKELKDLGLKKNLEEKVKLCESAEELILTESISESFKVLQDLHKKWREVGPVPHDKKDEVWDRFKAATDNVNQRRREHYSKLREGQQGNYEAKVNLCERAEEVLKADNPNVKDWQANTDKMQALLAEWKTVGQAPKKVNDEIWERFKASLDSFFGNKKEFFAKLKDQQLNNYNLKIELCLQAEAIKEDNDWKNTTRSLIKLQEDWKKVGPVPKKHSDKVWKRFRAACDEFFNAKESYFKNIHKHEDENLKLKKELIEKVKAYEVGEDKNADLETLKGFQREWMKIGHVPFSEKDKAMKEFREVVDSKFNKLKISSAEKNTLNFKSKFENVKGTSDGNRVIYREKNVMVSRIKKMEEDIKLWENNVGFLANSKNANLLKVEFEKKIEKAKEDMDLLKQKLRILDNMD